MHKILSFPSTRQAKSKKGYALIHIPFCQPPCPSSAIVFFETCFIDSYPRAIFLIVYLFSIGTYSRVGFTPIYAGRMIFPAFCSSSRRWALQPAMRAIAKIGVYSSHGRWFSRSCRHPQPQDWLSTDQARALRTQRRHKSSLSQCKDRLCSLLCLRFLIF